jgi:hypothetical protein
MDIPESRYVDLWRDIDRLLLEGRRVNMRLGIGEECPEFCRALRGYAYEAMEQCKENLRRPVDAELIPCAP